MRPLKWGLLLLFFAQYQWLSAGHREIADSILVAYKLPALGYAVVATDGVVEIEMLGVKKTDGGGEAKLADRFRIGSNTKAFTALMAAMLVKAGKIQWETKFFGLFPEWKAHSLPCYHALTLAELLSFRNWLPMWTYTFPKPRPSRIRGDAITQREQFGRWIFKQPELHSGAGYNHSNLGYVAAGLMLERASGKSYESLAAELGKRLQIHIGFGQPNATDADAVWGHDERLIPEKPGESVRLNWLMAAGNIQISLPDYARFLQEFLLGLQGKSALLPSEDFERLLFGYPDFAMGWFWETNANGERVAHNLGNPGTFMSRVILNATKGRAYIVLTNCMTTESVKATELLIQRLQD